MNSPTLALTLVLAALIAQSKPLSFSTDQRVLGKTANPRPLVIWHGLGDTALSEGISSFITDIKDLYPGIFVHSVQIPEGGSPDDERKAGFFGNATLQGDWGCEQIKSIPELDGGFDGMGFSQGGLFLRYYAQYCDGPPIHNLITHRHLSPRPIAAQLPLRARNQFGTPHMGISSLIPCPTPPTLTCLLSARAARSGIYTHYAQTHLIQAQYYRDPSRLTEFLDVNSFLRDLNGEGPPKTQGKGVDELNNLVAVVFEADRTVSPAQSAHFATYSPDNKTLIVPMYDQPMYKEDWIGLRSLDEKGGLKLERCPGEHMDLGGGDCGMRMVRDWVGWDVDQN